MTQLAEERGAGQDEAVARISHWIDGRSVPGESGRTGPVYNPATGRQAGGGDLAAGGGGRSRVGRGRRPRGAGGEGGAAGMARDVARSAGRDLLPHPQARGRA